jgi:hypothetical protein
MACRPPELKFTAESKRRPWTWYSSNHVLVVDEETLNVRRIVIRTSVETRLNCAEVDAPPVGVTHVGAMVVVPVELPQVVDGVHVVVHNIEEHCESPLMTSIHE